MVHIKALEILNDYNENRKILSKLLEWLITDGLIRLLK